MPPKETTLLDIAKELNISESTVSRALNNHPAISDKTKKKVQALVESKGYRLNNFASNLAKKTKPKTIGLIVHKLNSYFITTALAAIEEIVSAEGYDLIIAQSSESAEKEINNANNLFQKRVDGLIATLVYTTENTKHIDQFVNKGIPVVFFDRVDMKTKGTKIIINNKKAAYEATLHLIKQGCKRIAITTAGIDGLLPNARVTGTHQRYEGYRKALADNNIPYEDRYLFIKEFNHENDGVIAAQEIMAMDPLPDGIFMTNDFHAVICMKELMRNGIRIPEDIAIVGFNNDFMSRMVEPTLSSVNNPAFIMGETAAKHLMQQLNGNIPLATDCTITVESELLIRASSARKK